MTSPSSEPLRLKSHSRLAGIVVLAFTAGVLIMVILKFAWVITWWQGGTAVLRVLIGAMLVQLLLLLAVAARSGIKLYMAGGSQKPRSADVLDTEMLPDEDA